MIFKPANTHLKDRDQQCECQVRLTVACAYSRLSRAELVCVCVCEWVCAPRSYAVCFDPLFSLPRPVETGQGICL